MKEFSAEIDDHIKEYEHGTITISEDTRGIHVGRSHDR
jgi:hypothetical protein